MSSMIFMWTELDEFLQELDEDVEGMQGTIYFLQQQLKTSKETVLTLTQELNALRQNTNGTPQQVCLALQCTLLHVNVMLSNKKKIMIHVQAVK
jgi:hypothetical protein